MANPTDTNNLDAVTQACVLATLKAVTAFLEGRAAIQVVHNPEGYGVRFLAGEKTSP